MRVRGWSVDWIDAVLVFALLVCCGLAYSAPAVTREIVGESAAGGAVLVALLLVSLGFAVGISVDLVTRKRTYRKD